MITYTNINSNSIGTVTCLATALLLSTAHNPNIPISNYKPISEQVKNYSQLQNTKHPLAEFLGSWKGNDIKEMLELVYTSRSKF